MWLQPLVYLHVHVVTASSTCACDESLQCMCTWSQGVAACTCMSASLLALPMRMLLKDKMSSAHAVTCRRARGTHLARLRLNRGPTVA